MTGNVNSKEEGSKGVRVLPYYLITGIFATILKLFCYNKRMGQITDLSHSYSYKEKINVFSRC